MRVAAAALCVLLAGGCSSPDVPADAGADGAADGPDLFCFTGCVDATVDVSVATRLRGLFGQICTQDGCHGGGAAQAGLVVPSGNEFGMLIDVRSTQMPTLLRVKPGDPAASYAYLKLSCEGGIIKGCMPPGGRLAPAVIQSIHDWIEAGAPAQ